jgi:hypothetical protein
MHYRMEPLAPDEEIKDAFLLKLVEYIKALQTQISRLTAALQSTSKGS